MTPRLLLLAFVAVLALGGLAEAADNNIPIPSGQKLDTEQLTSGINLVERQRVQIGGATLAAIAAVANTPPAGTEYGLLTRPIMSPTPDTVGTTVVLDTSNEIAFAAAAGQQSCQVTFAANATLATSVIKPVISTDGGTTASDFLVDKAYFVTSAGASVATQDFALADPTQPLTLQIKSYLPFTHCGVKMTTYGSGNTSATVRALAQQSIVAMAGTNGAALVIPSVTTIGSRQAMSVAIDHALATYGYTRPSACTAIANVNDTPCAINGSGGGQVSFDIPSGATGTFEFEARVGSGTWFATKVSFKTGQADGTSVSTFPARGWFHESGWSEYRIRPSDLTAGSTTPVIIVSPGAGLVRALKSDGANTDLVDPCSSVAQTTTPFSVIADTVLIPKDTAKRNYVCAFAVVETSTSEIWNFIEGDGSTCASNQQAIVGSVTDADGLGKPMALSGGGRTLLYGKTVNRDFCIRVSGANRISGFITWVQR
jgi:hypothetical protein